MRFTNLARTRTASLDLVKIFSYAFFFSGFSALLYQVAWQRMLGLFAGSDVRSVTIIVGAYLSGIGIGGLIGSLIADRFDSRQAVRLFGLCDLGIAAFAFASRWIFYDLLFLRLNTLAASSAPLLLAAFVSLLVPTVLMGLSLPLLSKALVRSIAEAPQRIGGLYAINTLGSAMGALISGLFLISTLGFERTVYLGGGLNALVGLTALLLSPRFVSGDGDAAKAAPGAWLRGVPRDVWAWCLLSLVSGFIAISLELIWFRLLSVLVEPRAYMFAHMLAFVLMGYAIGSWLGARMLSRVRRPRRLFFALQAAAVLYVLASFALLYLNYDTIVPFLFESRDPLGSDASLAPQSQRLLFGYLVIPALLLLPPNVLIGLNFPVTQRAVQTDLAYLGQRIGLVQMSAIVGNTAGSIVTGLLLFELIGTAGAIRVVTALGLAFLLLLLWEQRAATTRGGTLVAWGASAALAIALVSFPANSVFWTRLHGGTAANTLVAEDSTGLSAIRDDGEAAAIFANGVLEGRVPFMSIHQTLGVVPALAHPAPAQVLIIGIGSAGTPYAAGLSSATRHITAVEINGAELPVLKAAVARSWGAPLQAFFADPRVEVVVGDGRRVLALSDRRYDLIQADAIHPWRSHSGMLYSREFFEQARAKLAEGGLMAQWAPTQRTINTFMQVFPYGVNIGSVLLLGSTTPIEADPAAWLERLASPRVSQYLAQGHINPRHARDFLTSSTITSWSPEAERMSDINTDLWPRDEYQR